MDRHSQYTSRYYLLVMPLMMMMMVAYMLQAVGNMNSGPKWEEKMNQKSTVVVVVGLDLKAAEAMMWLVVGLTAWTVNHFSAKKNHHHLHFQHLHHVSLEGMATVVVVDRAACLYCGQRLEGGETESFWQQQHWRRADDWMNQAAAASVVLAIGRIDFPC
jgi:hypothetical protein